MEEKEKKNEPTILTLIKQNIKLIGMIVLVVIIISLMNMNSHIMCKKMSGGIGPIQSAAVGTIKNLTSKCKTNLFEDGLHRFRYITDNVMGVIGFIIALLLLPTFPIFLYVGAMYLIFSQMFKGMRMI